MFENTDFLNSYKIILSAPKKDSKYKKGVGRRIELQGREVIQFEMFTDKQAFHYNVELNDLEDFFTNTFNLYFTQAQVYTKDYTYGFRMTSKGHLLSNKKKNNEEFVVLNNNKKKTYLLEEGMIIAPLIDLGVMTPEGKIVKAYYDKFKQINRFLSIIDDVLEKENKKELNIIDFGCGKSYLTFIVYYYLTFVKKINVTMTGLDLKEDVIKKCNEISQHEINLQLTKSSNPLINKYGLVKDRFAAILTDSIRANLLEYMGYDVSMIEFIDFAQTPKNILIRAIKKSDKKNLDSLKNVENTLKEYNIHQTLYDLLTKEA